VQSMAQSSRRFHDKSGPGVALAVVANFALSQTVTTAPRILSDET